MSHECNSHCSVGPLRRHHMNRILQELHDGNEWELLGHREWIKGKVKLLMINHQLLIKSKRNTFWIPFGCPCSVCNLVCFYTRIGMSMTAGHTTFISAFKVAMGGQYWCPVTGSDFRTRHKLWHYGREVEGVVQIFGDCSTCESTAFVSMSWAKL